MFYNFIILYLILLCLYSYVKIKKNVELTVYTNGQLFIQISIIFGFILFYFIGLRLLNLFRLNKLLDLHNINFNITLILTLILVYFFRKLIFYFFKISFFKFHYVMMCESNFSFKIQKRYKIIYYNFIFKPAFYSFKYLIYLNYVMIIVLIIFLCYDLLFNDLILNYSLIFLKYYSIFKVVYLSYKFMITKQNLVLDYYSYNLLYPGIIEHNFFMNYSDFKHYSLMEESKKYSAGVILEKNTYVPKFLGDTAEMPFFKSLNR